MKKIISLTTLALAALTICSCQPKEKFTITGNYSSPKEKLILKVLEGKEAITIDSVEFDDAKFELSGTVETPAVAQIVDGAGRHILYFLLENKPMNIDIINGLTRPHATINGPENTVAYNDFVDKKYDVTNRKSYDSLVNDFVKNNTNNTAAAYTFFREMAYRLSAKEIREMAATFAPEVQKSSYIVKALERAQNIDKVAVGQKFTDFTLKNTENKKVSLSDVAGKGKWVLVDFWAAWCPPCRAENPNVVNMFEQYNDKGFTVFGVSLDKEEDKWKQAIEKDKLGNWTNVSDLKYWNCAPAVAYGVTSIPSNVLIDPNGIIVAHNLKGKALQNKLEEIFNK